MANRKEESAEKIRLLVKDRVRVFFLASVFLFHLSNAAMLPQSGQLLSKDNPKAAAAFMSACIIVTQLVIASTAARIGMRALTKGRRPLLLFGFAVLPIRGMLYTMTQVPVLLIVIQILDGVANCISVVVSILVIKDRTEGTGRFNITADAMATVHGVGAALSAALGGLLIQRWGFKASFAGLAVTVLWWKIPETRKEDPVETSLRPSSFSVPSLPAEDA